MPLPLEKREHDDLSRGFAADVLRGLRERPRSLPSKYLYDALGSQLFEAICRLPWYPVTRAETALLDDSAKEMVAPLGELGLVVELGPGSGDKFARLARAIRAARIRAHLVDISPEALDLAKNTLSRQSNISVVCHAATYEAGLVEAMGQRPARGSALVLFLGSNIGNFDAEAAQAMLASIRRALRPGDGLLLGADLVRSEAELLRAYDDPLGVTAAFDKNLLVRMNGELGADFDLNAWGHRAVWNAAASRVEMHLVSRRKQRVRVPAAKLTVEFHEGETIWTESSYKYTPESIAALGERVGLVCRGQWIEPRYRFASTLFMAGQAH